jgi:hypothetical protein
MVAWCIRFLGYYAFRMRTIGYYETKPLTRPDQRKATWEIAPSTAHHTSPTCKGPRFPPQGLLGIV